MGVGHIPAHSPPQLREVIRSVIQVRVLLLSLGHFAPVNGAVVCPLLDHPQGHSGASLPS